MPAALLATTLMLALGQVPANPNVPMQPYPGPANQGYGLGPNYGPGQAYGPGTAYDAGQAYGVAPAQDPGMAYGPGYGTADYGAAAAGPGIPGSLNNAYMGYRHTAGYGAAGGFGTSTFNYAYPNYDAYEPWVHGHWQELPAFGGHAYFRPYNYRHVYSQSEVAASWGTSAVMPYSHEYFRRPREQGIYEQRQSASVRSSHSTNSAAIAYRQQPRATQQNNETIARTAGVRTATRQPAAAPTRQAANGPSLFPRSRN